MPQKTMEQLRSGDDSSYESIDALYKTHSTKVFSFFANRGFSKEDSRDLTQETFVAAFDSFDSFRGDAAPGTWLFSVAINIWRSSVRKSNRLKRHGQNLPIEVLDHEDGMQHQYSDKPQESRQLEKCLADERTRLLREALEQLPEGMRQCVVLRLKDELKYREIAAILGVSINTVRSQLFDARKKLQSLLAGHFPEIAERMHEETS